jgi:hypothetical protein
MSATAVSIASLADIGLASSHLREGTVVPEIALVGEAVAHIAELALFNVLLDGVERLLLRDLWPSQYNGC